MLRSTERENIDKVIAELEKLGFFDAPASRKDHNSFSGGLVAHSLNVYRVAKEISLALCNINPDLEVSDDSLIIASLLHDICKAPRYQGSSQKNGEYQKNYSHLPVGHGEKSVIVLLQCGLELTDEEIMAIRWHMHAWDLPFQSADIKGNLLKAKELYPLVSLIQAADGLSSNLLERNAEEQQD